jgi:hypothetical protein
VRMAVREVEILLAAVRTCTTTRERTSKVS